MEIKFLTREELLLNIGKYCDLYKSRFTADINEEVVIHRFIDNPYKDIFICVAEENGRYIANSSIIPTKIQFGGNLYKSALSINMMTHPDYAGRGIISNIVDSLYSHLGEEGYKLIYGFPNYISNHILNDKFGRRDVYEYPTLEKEVSQVTPDGDVRFCGIEEINDYTTDRIKVSKSVDYLNWRYAKDKSSEYFIIKSEINGWAIFKKYQDMVNIVEFHPVSIDDMKKLMGYIEHFACENQLKKLTIWSMINTTEHNFMEKIGFRNKYPITYFSVLDLGFANEAQVDVYDYRNWKINMGDDNVY